MMPRAAQQQATEAAANVIVAESAIFESLELFHERDFQV
jgi:hypothetical protein